MRDNEVLSLVIAAGRLDLAKVRSLLLEGLRVDKTKGEHKITALYAAADNLHGDIRAEAVITELLRAGARVDKAVSGGRTPLLAAVRKNNINAVELLLQGGADANKGDDEGAYPLMVAVYNIGDLSDRGLPVLKHLLTAGADTNRANDKGTTPLYAAVGSDNAVAVELNASSGGRGG
jgi:ankyrin repeat protein